LLWLFGVKLIDPGSRATPQTCAAVVMDVRVMVQGEHRDKRLPQVDLYE